MFDLTIVFEQLWCVRWGPYQDDKLGAQGKQKL